MRYAPWKIRTVQRFLCYRHHLELHSFPTRRSSDLIEQGGGTLEYRFRHRDGRYIWIQDTFRDVRDDAGQPLEIVDSWADISDRKQAEQALGERMALMNDLQNLAAASSSVIYNTQTT